MQMDVLSAGEVKAGIQVFLLGTFLLFDSPSIKAEE
jgi:hypothetical protein